MNTYPANSTTRASGADLAKLYAIVLGVILTVLGILGFIPAIAPNGYLFTILAVDPVHNFFHLATGLAGLGVALAVVGLYRESTRVSSASSMAS
ncbi:MAG TPA: DUF4383 domain-containing protein [Ktedonobacterales bacterium]|nr:DUF4383 domain-containing protein [Ktedonobacterales bacterium]